MSKIDFDLNNIDFGIRPNNTIIMGERDELGVFGKDSIDVTQRILMITMRYLYLTNEPYTIEIKDEETGELRKVTLKLDIESKKERGDE